MHFRSPRLEAEADHGAGVKVRPRRICVLLKRSKGFLYTENVERVLYISENAEVGLIHY